MHTPEEILVDLLAVLLWNEHDCKFLALFGESHVNAVS